MSQKQLSVDDFCMALVAWTVVAARGVDDLKIEFDNSMGPGIDRILVTCYGPELRRAVGIASVAMAMRDIVDREDLQLELSIEEHALVTARRSEGWQRIRQAWHNQHARGMQGGDVLMILEYILGRRFDLND